MDGKTSEWRPGPSVCRCCLAEGCYKDISTEYFWMGKREVYSEMLSETFSVSIAYSSSGGPNSNSRLICEPCISRLRDAADFKRQVQECEKTFMQHLDPGGTSTVPDLDIQVLPEEKEVKLEQVKLEKRFSDDEFDNVHFADDDDDDMDDQPLTKFATKVPKKETVDFLDLIDNSQITVKRKSTTKTKTPPTKKVKVTKKEAKPTASKAPIKIVAEKKKKANESKSIARSNAKLIVGYATIYPFRLPEKNMACVFCEQSFDHPADFRCHVRNQHKCFQINSAFSHLPVEYYLKVDCTELRCRICSEPFQNLVQIAKHLKENHHEGKNLNLEHELGLLPFIFLNNQYGCAICSNKFTSIRALSRHTHSHFVKYTCETCGKLYASVNTLNVHVLSHVTDGALCRRCKATFASIDERKEHLKQSPNCWQHSCNVCGERFMTQQLRRNHLVEGHGTKLTYNCPECPKVFGTAATRRYHFIISHTNYSLPCPHCDKSFVTKSKLDEHKTIHTGIKLFVCDYCSKSFARRWCLVQHMSTHDSKKHKCTTCRKEFSFINNWRSHINTCGKT